MYREQPPSPVGGGVAPVPLLASKKTSHLFPCAAVMPGPACLLHLPQASLTTSQAQPRKQQGQSQAWQAALPTPRFHSAIFREGWSLSSAVAMPSPPGHHGHPEVSEEGSRSVSGTSMTSNSNVSLILGIPEVLTTALGAQY